VTVFDDDSEGTIYNKKAFELARAFSDGELGATDPVFDFDHFARAAVEIVHELASGPDQLPPRLEWAAVGALERDGGAVSSATAASHTGTCQPRGGNLARAKGRAACKTPPLR
jgi:hypothetical protein